MSIKALAVLALLQLALCAAVGPRVGLSAEDLGVREPLGNVLRELGLDAAAQERAAQSFFLRVMPLGASITEGVNSPEHDGYRKYLRDQLRFMGWKVNMVGTKREGAMADRDNEGHPGWIIDQVTSAAKTAVPQSHPNVVLINAGTNDCIGNIDIPNAGKRMKTMVDYVFSAVPNTLVVLSTVVPSQDSSRNSCAANISAQYRSLITSSYSGKRVALADVNAFLTPTDADIGSDQIHPTDAGYKKMAAVWWDAIRRFESQIQAPDSTVDDAKQVGPANCDRVKGTERGPVQTQQGSGTDDGNYVHSSIGMGTLKTFDKATYPNLPQNIYFAQLVNAGGADRGGELDELIIVSEANGVATFQFSINSGGGSFGSLVSFDTGLKCVPSSGAAMAWRDLNNDGLDDFFCITNNGAVSVSLNQGGNPPTFKSIGQIIASQGTNYTNTDVRIADIDGDGRADYCLMNANSDVRCWRSGGQNASGVDFWQGYASSSPGDVVFTGKNKPNKAGVNILDLNGDFRDDWMYIGDQGDVDTYINQRGSGFGIVPAWIGVGTTHKGMGTPGVQLQIKFGRIYGSGRKDYVYVQDVAPNWQINVWQNVGSGGTQLKGDGVFYCDMRGLATDDYVWISPTGRGEIYENIHIPPNWIAGPNPLFDIARPRMGIHLADFDGDGRCDILSQRKSDGAIEMWKNNYNLTSKTYQFDYVGWVATAAQCTAGWGVGIFDRGLRFADIDGDGRADYLCLDASGKITGYLNKASGMISVGQVRAPGGWDRANIRFADIQADGKADMIWLDKYRGEPTVYRNEGQVAASDGNSFSWTDLGVLFNGVDRGANLHFPNLGGLHRADLHQVVPTTNVAYTYFSECTGADGGDDGPISDPGLPAYST